MGEMRAQGGKRVPVSRMLGKKLHQKKSEKMRKALQVENTLNRPEEFTNCDKKIFWVKPLALVQTETNPCY